jgi:site-specific recombinase XerD
MNHPKRRPPLPIIDNLAMLKDRLLREATIHRLAKTSGYAGVDYQTVTQFLLSYDGSMDTFNAYRRELERLLQWSWLVQEKSVHSLNRDDIIAFIEFLMDPPLAWIGVSNAPRFVSREADRQANPKWRPFVATVTKSAFREGNSPESKHYQPSQSSVQAAFAVLSSYYDFLLQESYVETNPVSIIRQKSKFLQKDHNQAIVRRISVLQWDYVLETTEQMAQADPAMHERSLFVMTALFAMYLRVSELVSNQRSTPVMGDFKRDRDGNWWFHVTGKGNKHRTVTVSDAMLGSLKRYRVFRELSELPPPNDPLPLVPKTRGGEALTSTRQLRRVVQTCFDMAFQRMREDGMEEDALDLKESTVHWLRHTGISEDVKTRPREHVRDDAGHASMATTDRYIESDQRERHLSGKRKQVKLLESD